MMNVFATGLLNNMNQIRFFMLLVSVILSGLGCTVANGQTLTEKIAKEDPAQLVEQAREYGDIVRGAILFHQGNINCAKCHRPTAEEQRIGPDLGRLEAEVTNESLVESILYPSRQIKKGYESIVVQTADGQVLTGTKVSESETEIVIREISDVDKLVTIKKDDLDGIRAAKKSSMPDKLVDELKNRQQFLDLLRYVVDLRERAPDAATTVNADGGRRQPDEVVHGLVLIQKFNCIACHATESLQSFPVAAKLAPRLQWSSEHLNPDYIKAFVQNPHAIKPGSTMPDLMSQMDDAKRTAAAEAITHYLISKTQNEFQVPVVDSESASRGHALFHQVGCVACHSPRAATGDEQPVSETTPLGNLSKKYSLAGLTEFLEDPLVVRPSGHMPNMVLSHREAVDLSNFLLQVPAGAGATELAIQATDWSVDDELVAKGKALFAEQNCIKCHTDFMAGESDMQAAVAPALAKLNVQTGCLSSKGGAWPVFDLQDDERKSIQAALAQHPVTLNDTQRIEGTLYAYNCTACHSRGDLGGVAVDRNPHFQTTNLNLGDQGRIPPTLTGVGAKLNRKWLRDVLVNRRSIRPCMNTRMPQFGEQNVGHLLDLFEANDDLAETRFAEFEDQKAMRKKGHELAGHKGLNCVACHTYQYKTSDTMPAVDLTEMTERLKKDWFYQYMLTPQSFSPNTVMPSFWPGGKAIRPDIEGSPEDQIEALWQYLIDGRQARAPSGVVREPLEIVVADEARMLRRSYPGIGKRGIGVGYPGNVNIAFDAEQMRLAAIWRGKFAEAGGVWRGQGSGKVRLLGRPIEFAKGPDLDSDEQPWIVDDTRPPDHQFKGYTLDQARQPTFRYTLDSVNVQDFCEPLELGGQVQLQRTVTMNSSEQQTGLRFRIATASEIEESDDVFTLDDKLQIQIVSEQEVKVVDDGEQKHLQLQFDIAPNEPQQLILRYLWGAGGKQDQR